MSSMFEKIMKYDTANRIVYNNLCKSMKSAEGVLPFIGAGISAFAYGTWEQLLYRFSEDLLAKDRKTVENAIAKGDYFRATDLLCKKYGETLFYSELRETFSEDKIDDIELKKSTAFLVPKLCHGDCITTNFDRVLEHACSLNNMIPDRALPTNTNQLNEHQRNGKRKSALIFKIHGDVLSNKEEIILTGKSYDEHYNRETPLKKQLTKWIDNRKLLFLGASLKQDKTVDLLKERMEEGMYNYTIYGCKQAEIADLKKHFEEMNIMAIFYDSDNHDCLKVVLSHLIREMGL